MIDVVKELEAAIVEFKRCQNSNDLLNRYEYADEYNDDVSYYESCIEYECEELKRFITELRDSIKVKESRLNNLRYGNRPPVFIYLRKDAA